MAATECTPADEAVFAAGSRDSRIVAAVPMAGTLSTDWFTPDAYASVDIPIMTLTGTDDPINQQAQWDRISGIDYTWIDIVGACHQAFALGGCGELRDADADLIINSYTLTFGRRWVLGDMREETTNVLSGRTQVSLAALFLKKN
ncbi:MAG: hypothetical protein R3E66_21245 [bacterium]